MMAFRSQRDLGKVEREKADCRADERDVQQSEEKAGAAYNMGDAEIAGADNGADEQRHGGEGWLVCKHESSRQ